ncbi:MAG: ABC transporter ATP-binding protein, partial [Clostridia bacterium]
LINGVNIKNMTLGEIGKKIGYVYQDPSKQLFATTVYEELAFPLEMKNAENINETVIKQLESFDLLHLKDKFPFFLSQGEKQRLVIAGILIEKPNFLILDEPTTSLDVKRKEELKKMLIDLKENYNIGIIIISHDHDFLNALSPLEVRIEK